MRPIVIPSQAVTMNRRERRDARADRAFRLAMTSVGLIVLALLLGAAASMLWGGREALATFGLDFFG
ncbi:phosphate ABC transporter permease subunit PstC, partial [Xanthomonadaceae bacterium JHOS43]|nr:phosphate ABC transporter permease subunit PstC [Xanthomonadaceae bacterium JHOS43]